MSTDPLLPPNVPSTPVRILQRVPSIPMGPFYVSQEQQIDDDSVPISDEEISALAQIIYNAYLEWKQQ